MLHRIITAEDRTLNMRNGKEIITRPPPPAADIPLSKLFEKGVCKSMD